ncbi:MAG: hypothetical protein NTZ97_04250 [Candidatus Moranbacteria bacterium]|nr:hypothetical protein [Candidatus Moranbacteria bacterium]
MEQPSPTAEPSQSSGGMSSGTKTILWVVGGCLILLLIIGVAISGFIWWGARKVKKEFDKSQPKIEQWSKDMQKQSEEMQKQVEQMQKNLPAVPENTENPVPVQ